MIDITIFIGLLFLFIFYHSLMILLLENDEIFFALIIILIFGFAQPLILNWYLNFLFGITLSYWTAFGALVVLDFFTFKRDEKYNSKKRRI